MKSVQSYIVEKKSCKGVNISVIICIFAVLNLLYVFSAMLM